MMEIERKSRFRALGEHVRRRGVAIAISGAAVIALGGILAMPGKKKEGAAVVPAPVNVEVVTIEPRAEIRDAFLLHGIVEPNRVVRIAAEVPGRIERIALREGQRCTKGQKLFFLNTDLLQAEFDRAKAQAEFDAREHKRVRELQENHAATVEEVDQFLAKAATSAAEFALAEARLRRTVIAAPIDAVVNRIPVEEGEYVTAGQRVAELVETDVVKVAVDVPERDVHWLRLGSEEGVLGDRGLRRIGRITYLGELTDEGTRTTPVEITVDNADQRLRSGIVSVELERQVLRNVVVIPLEAVIPLQEDPTEPASSEPASGPAARGLVLERGRVFVARRQTVREGGKDVEVDVAERRDVKLGLIRGAEVVVLEGLRAGDRLIVPGHSFVTPGQRVAIQNP